jgi:Domain of unknown function (DUF4394)
MIVRNNPKVAVTMRIAVSATLMLAASAAHSQNSIAAGLSMPQNRSVYALTTDNAIYVLRPGASQYTRLARIESNGDNLIGIDFRPADRNPNRLYALGDRGVLYTIDLSANPNPFIQAQRVSTMNPQFTGGFGNVMDFNPVANALRVMGTNDQNLAVVNGADGSNLSTTVAQTNFAYVTGDVNAGQDPEITGGAYTNNFVGATTTLFYMVDHAKDTLVTIATKTATGSSNTASGGLQTIGSFVGQDGTVFNMSPTTDFDIYTDANGTNFLIGQTTRLLFSIDLSQVNPNLKVGQTQKIVVKRGSPAPLVQAGGQSPLTGGIFDIAIPPRTTP